MKAEKPPKAPEPAEDHPAPEREMVEVVRFNGAPGVREISAEDWAGAGVPDHPTTRWDSSNNWTVMREELALTDDAWNRVIVADVGLLVQRVPVDDSA